MTSFVYILHLQNSIPMLPFSQAYEILFFGLLPSYFNSLENLSEHIFYAGDFLIANRKEVISMSIFEYDEEKELKLLREAEYQAGVEDGIEIGEKNGIEIGRKDGIEICRLKSLKIMKRNFKDFESVYHELKNEEIFSDLSKEEINVLFDQI